MRSCRSDWLFMSFGWRGPVLWCSSRNGPSCMMKPAGGGPGSAGLWRRRAHPAQLWRGALPLLGRVDGGRLVPVRG